MSRIPVSVIVAVYNAEKTIVRLADSLKAQTMQNFEVLLIDDGSTDASGSLCDEIAQSDDRFKVFHKQNQGIGATRQFGIEHAKGEYTIHADSDDWVEPDYLELLYNKAVSSKADMVICDFVVEDGKRSVRHSQKPSAFDKDSMIHELLCHLQKGPCNKLIRRSAYMNRNIRYADDLDIGEDFLFNLQLIIAGISVTYVSKALYHYDTVTNPHSASRGGSLKKIQQGEKLISALRDILPENYQYGIDDKHLDIVYTAIKSKALTKSDFKEKYSLLKRVKWRNYYNKPFSYKLIIWSSLHISYRLAIVLYDVKSAIGKLRHSL